MRWASRPGSTDEQLAGPILLLLGLATFPLLLAGGLLVHKTAPLELFDGHRLAAAGFVLGQLSPLISLAALPALVLGMLLHQRLAASKLSAERTTGTTLALLAVGLLLLAVWLGWPNPAQMVAVGLVNSAALALVAVRYRLPELHLPALVCLAIAYLTGLHLWQGAFAEVSQNLLGQRMIECYLAGRSGLALLLLSGLAGAGGTLWWRRGRLAEARVFAWATGGLAGISVAIAAYAGFWSGIDAELATPVFAICALLLPLASLRLQHPAIGWTATSLALVTLCHGLAANPWLIARIQDGPAWLDLLVRRPITIACLGHAALASVVTVIVRTVGRHREQAWQTALVEPFGQSALGTSALALPWIFFASPGVGETAGLTGWASLCWLVTAATLFSPSWFVAGQVLATATVCLTTTRVCHHFAWWADWEHPLCDPRHLHIQGSVLLLWSSLWLGAGWLARGSDRALALLRVWCPSFERWIAGTVLLAFVVLCAIACLPGIAAELASRPIQDPFGILASPAYVHAYGGGAWIVLALAVSVLTLSLWERFSKEAVLGQLFVAIAVPLLMAGQFEVASASATALRWGLSLYALTVAVLSWQQRWWPALADRAGWPQWHLRSVGLGADTRRLILLLAVLPVLANSLVIADYIAGGAGLGGPDPDSLFGRISVPINFAGPLVMVALLFVGYAVRLRSAGYALAGGLTINLAVSLGYVLPFWLARTHLGGRGLIELIQWNTVACAGYALAWLAGRRWLEPPAPPVLAGKATDSDVRSLLGVQLLLALMGNGLLIGPALLAIILMPGDVPIWAGHVGTSLGTGALLLTVGAVAWFRWKHLPEEAAHLAGGFGLAFAALLAAATTRGGQSIPWLSYRMLDATWILLAYALAAVAWALPLLGYRRWTTARPVWITWSSIVGMLAFGGAARGVGVDPLTWWPTAATAAVTLLAGALGLLARAQSYAYASVALAMLATTFLWLAPGPHWLADLKTARDWLALIHANLSVTGLLAMAWLGVTVWWQRVHCSSFDRHSASPPVHHSVAGISLMVLAALVALALMVGVFPTANPVPTSFQPGQVTTLAGWQAWAILVALLAATLWDPDGRHALPSLYVCGLVLAGMVLVAFDQAPRDLLLRVGFAASGYALVTATIWTQRERLAAWAWRLAIPAPQSLRNAVARWLPQANAAVAVLVVGIAFWGVLTLENMGQRFQAVGSVALVAACLGLLTSGSIRSWLPVATTTLAAVALVDFAWALMPVVQDPQYLLSRSIRLMVALAAVTFLYGLLLARLLQRQRVWSAALSHTAAGAGVAATAVLVVILGLELLWYQPNLGAPVTGLQIAAVTVALLGLAMSVLGFAIRSDLDPLRLSEPGRRIYVYAAELILALLFVHIRLTIPELFTGRMQHYWPLIVMAIAFAGVGLGELFDRLRLSVLAEPLTRSAAFLPLLPMLGFWLVSSRMEYSTVLFGAGILYALLAGTRRSMALAILAALVGNAGLWALWAQQGRAVLEHPQIWLIPPAVSVLVAVHLNRDRLTAAQATAARYFAIMIIYVSSTAEMFVRGIADSFWLPVILATLSILGVFCGVALRVRAFLYLGSTFLLVSLVSMVYHAYRNIGHVWPWWAFGILSGIAILTAIGVFEKKRNEVLQLADELKQWES